MEFVLFGVVRDGLLLGERFMELQWCSSKKNTSAGVCDNWLIFLVNIF